MNIMAKIYAFLIVLPYFKRRVFSSMAPHYHTELRVGKYGMIFSYKGDELGFYFKPVPF